MSINKSIFILSAVVVAILFLSCSENIFSVIDCGGSKIPGAFSGTRCGEKENKCGGEKGDIPEKDNNSLIGWWSFNNISSDDRARDISGNNHDGTVINAESMEGIEGKALFFSGYNSGVDISDHSDFYMESSFTIDVWAQPTSLKCTHCIIFFRGDSRDGLDSYVLTVFPDTTLRFYVQESNEKYIVLKHKIELNVFIHIAAVFDKNENIASLYIDGQKVDSKILPPSFATLQALDESWNPGVSIGHHAMRSSNDYGFVGVIDEVKFYGEAIYPQQN